MATSYNNAESLCKDLGTSTSFGGQDLWTRPFGHHTLFELACVFWGVHTHTHTHLEVQAVWKSSITGKLGEMHSGYKRENFRSSHPVWACMCVLGCTHTHTHTHTHLEVQAVWKSSITGKLGEMHSGYKRENFSFSQRLEESQGEMLAELEIDWIPYIGELVYWIHYTWEAWK